MILYIAGIIHGFVVGVFFWNWFTKIAEIDK